MNPKRIDITNVDYPTKFGIKLLVVSDTHGSDIAPIIEILSNTKPDGILVPGDFMNGRILQDNPDHSKQIAQAITDLNALAEAAETYVSIGNHEKHLTVEERNSLKCTKAHILDNDSILAFDSILIGGLSSATVYTNKRKQIIPPDLDFLREYENKSGFKLLLCHHPEYYPKYVKDTSIDLIISGHAHGGQIRIGKTGLFAPDQGIFPKYTSGLYDNRLLVSRGVSGTEITPRINNRPEVMVLTL